ncbi:LysR family transcriptional regulator [Corallococcus praedator]|uniref:LysR family transcriptional regulator n=1 Tax=Corallococcus praedator TaxID=2316724 RepID=A0ABX9QHT1_9BACT|nr:MULTISPECIES: LysR family transcriptional regulator [Corallococcus]RKH18691.1 LysR family transcriptional regulator [Corallococcus sp. CA047B]RKH33757.1 LysR family transcriptional regulator [Corallococcus sp. CA031C]RKI07585.1 LysR family transcriptional regulator [Corallococcus praedator]
MDISWDDARLFLAIAETGSFSAAARRLRLGQPTVSRRLAALEYAVGAALFRRSVDGAALTAAGERLVVPAKKMAEWAGELHRAAESADSSPRGLVRVTSTPYLGFDFLAPFAAFVAQKHPGLRLEVQSQVQYLDLARGEADLALRSRPPTSPDLKLVDTLEFTNAVFVSKALKARLPKKVTLQQLPWVAWAPPFDTVPPNPQLESLIPGFAPSFTADNYLLLVAAAEAGLGAMVLGRMAHRFQRPTQLVPLELDLGPFARSQTHLVCAKSALDIPRVRRVSELLLAEFQRIRAR